MKTGDAKFYTHILLLNSQHQARRYKLATRDGNFIDTVFVDRRGINEPPQGRTLVLCCEGNAGFYEVGITATPIDAQYSVLGWNHPGFAGSTVSIPLWSVNRSEPFMQLIKQENSSNYSNLLISFQGIPFPSQEQNAIDIVMQFAIHRLGFRPQNIILYAWSIGAYTASWCAMNYPEIKGEFSLLPKTHNETSKYQIRNVPLNSPCVFCEF